MPKHDFPSPRRTGRADFPHHMLSTTYDALCGEVKNVAKWL
jgi:hypothetical protein